MFMESPKTTAKDCMFFTEKPATPPEVKKYRRSSALEPGQRFQHYGISDDLKTMNLDKNIYGVTSERTQATAAELLTYKKLTELEKINLVKSEKVYKGAAREPLGKTVDRNIKLPDKFANGAKAFGIGSKSSLEPAKGIIFPDVAADQYEGEDVYKVSHGSWPVGEQKTRNYQWPNGVNPLSSVFGNKGDQIALNGVSRNIAVVLNPPPPKGGIVNSKRCEDMSNSLDTLGKSKNLGQNSGHRPFGMIYGKPSNTGGKKSSKAQASACELLRGRYSEEDQKPEPDLGKSMTPGFRNISLDDRAFGVPSIRTDLPARPIGSRSVADCQNYGDDVPAQDLINPPAFSDISISFNAMNDARSKSKIFQTFRNIGYDQIDDTVFEIVFKLANEGFPAGYSSINQFRNVLNEYLSAVELGYEAYWLHTNAS